MITICFNENAYNEEEIIVAQINVINDTQRGM